jgi:UDP-arabinose 4-epimerase
MAERVLEAGYVPVVYDNLVNGHRDAIKWGPFEHGDIRDGWRLDAVLRAHRPSCVMHFAAYAYVGESVVDPSIYYNNNVAGTISLLDAMRRNDVDQLVFSSTCATYGVPTHLPVTEDTPQRPINPYGHTKLVIERMLADYQRAYGLKWASMRYFNAAGADPDGELGERHAPETHAIPLAIAAALGTGPRFKIFGTDYDTPDGSAVRDYVHVQDLADAHVAAIRYLDSGKESGAFNLATGAGTSVLEMLKAVEKAVGIPVPADLCPRRAGDPPALYAVAGKARRELGGSPRFATLEDIVATAEAWFTRSTLGAGTR